MKKIIILICVISTYFVLTNNANTVEASVTISYTINEDEQLIVISSRADQIETYYRTYNYVLQYRRWNITQNRWVDPDWINL